MSVFYVERVCARPCHTNVADPPFRSPPPVKRCPGESRQSPGDFVRLLTFLAWRAERERERDRERGGESSSSSEVRKATVESKSQIVKGAEETTAKGDRRPKNFADNKSVRRPTNCSRGCLLISFQLFFGCFSALSSKPLRHPFSGVYPAVS